MKKFIATGWYGITGKLFKIPTSIIQERSGILFYSEWNEPNEIATLKNFAKNFKHSLILRLEDIHEAGENNIGPTKIKIQLLKQFIDSHTDTDFVVACHAGISRTGATIDYLKEIHQFDIDIQNLKYNNLYFSPNRLMSQYFHELNPEFKYHWSLDYDPHQQKWIYNTEKPITTKTTLF